MRVLVVFIACLAVVMANPQVPSPYKRQNAGAAASAATSGTTFIGARKITTGGGRDALDLRKQILDLISGDDSLFPRVMVYLDAYELREILGRWGSYGVTTSPATSGSASSATASASAQANVGAGADFVGGGAGAGFGGSASSADVAANAGAFAGAIANEAAAEYARAGIRAGTIARQQYGSGQRFGGAYSAGFLNGYSEGLRRISQSKTYL